MMSIIECAKICYSLCELLSIFPSDRNSFVRYVCVCEFEHVSSVCVFFYSHFNHLAVRVFCAILHFSRAMKFSTFVIFVIVGVLGFLCACILFTLFTKKNPERTAYGHSYAHRSR